MRNRLTLLLAIAGCCVAFVMDGCQRDRDNPIDPKGSSTAAFTVDASLTADGVRLQWPAIDVAGIDGYRIYRSESSAESGQALGVVSARVSSYLDTTAMYLTTQWYRVTAVDNDGEESRLSGSDSVTASGARLSVSPHEWQPGSAKDSVYLHIRNDSIPCRFGYSVVTDSSWIRPSKENGVAPDSLLLRIDPNGTLTSRSCALMVTAAGVDNSPETVTIMQQTATSLPVLVVNPLTWQTTGHGGTSGPILVSIEGGNSITYTVTPLADWLTASPSIGTTPGSFAVSASVNLSDTSREGLVTIAADNVSNSPKTLKVQQERLQTSWGTLAGGMNGNVAALTAYQGTISERLVAAGYFTSAGNATVSGIAQWYGSEWYAMGTGTWNGAFTLTTLDGVLYAGVAGSGGIGYFYRLLLQWNGYHWDTLSSNFVGGLQKYKDSIVFGIEVSSGFPPHFWGVDVVTLESDGWRSLGFWSGYLDNGSAVLAAAVFDERLFVGGSFSRADSSFVSNIAAWDGSTWSPVGIGLNGTVRALMIYENTLVAAGDFASAGGKTVNNIARWDGISWEPLGSGLDSAVAALAVYQGWLIAGGSFVTSGGTTVNHIARWDGSTWWPIGAGFDDNVQALTVYDGRLTAGGAFTASGGTPVNRIAVLSESE